MLAKVQHFPTPAVLPPANPEFRVTFDPSATPPTPQFTFTNMDGTPVGNYIQIEDDTETISMTLDGADFAAVPIVWSFAPADGGPIPPPPSSDTISFTVPRPAFYFHPWMFRLIVNAGDDVKGIRSPNFFLVRQMASGPLTFNLKYAADNGNVSLLVEEDTDSPAGIDLDNELVLVNVLPGNFQINLDPDGTAATFASTPIQWSSGGQPGWISPNPIVPTTPTQLNFEITPEAVGQSAGLQFAIVVNGLTVLSPDPIIINATIGDG